MKSLSIRQLLLALLLCGLLTACDDDDDNRTNTPTPTPVNSTQFAVSVQLPAGSTVVKNERGAPLGWFVSQSVAVDEAVPGLDLSNFEVRLLNDDGTTANTVVIAEFIDNGDGTYFITVEGDPQIDCILVSTVQVDGNAVVLQIPAVDAGSQQDPVVINYASTAATRQYVESVVASGGFSQVTDNLTPEEVTALIDDVVEDLGAIVIPSDVDTSDPNAVIAALEQSAKGFVAAQIEIVAAPTPDEGSLAEYQGNYYGSLLETSAFGAFTPASFYSNFGVNYVDFSFGDGQTPLPGINITVDEAASSASLVIGGSVESSFEIIYSGSGSFGTPNAETELETEEETVPASITPAGKLFLQIPPVELDGFLFDPDGTRRYFISTVNQSPIPLYPWGASYLGSRVLTENEYLINDCLNDLGFTQEQVDGLDAEAYEALVDELNSSVAATVNTLSSQCVANAFGAEVGSFTFSKKPSGATLTDIAGTWAVIGFGIDLSRFPEGSIYNATMTINANGTGVDGDVIDLDLDFNFDDLNYTASAESFSGDNFTIAVSGDGIVEVEYPGDGAYRGYVNADFSLIHVPEFDVFSSEAEMSQAFLVPLSTGHTTAELDGAQFKVVGQLSSFESSGITSSGRLSFNNDSMDGLVLTFSQDGDAMNVALSGRTDLVRYDRFLGQGGVLNSYDVDALVDPVSDAENFGTASLTDDGKLTIVGDGGSTEIHGYIDANGRLVAAIISAESSQQFDDLAANGSTSFGDVNIGLVLGLPSN